MDKAHSREASTVPELHSAELGCAERPTADREAAKEKGTGEKEGEMSTPHEPYPDPGPAPIPIEEPEGPEPDVEDPPPVPLPSLKAKLAPEDGE